MSVLKKVLLSGTDMAYVLGVTQSQLSQWRRMDDNPIPSKGKDTSRSGHPVIFDGRLAVDWYVERKVRERVLGSQIGSGESTDDVIDFHTEKTRLTKGQADKIELENSVKQGKLAEMSVLVETLSNFGNIVRAGLDSIPAELRRKCPYMDQASLDEVETVISGIRNSLDGDSVRIPYSVPGAEEDMQ